MQDVTNSTNPPYFYYMWDIPVLIDCVVYIIQKLTLLYTPRIFTFTLIFRETVRYKYLAVCLKSLDTPACERRNI
jgi:hypothetical protein